MAAALVEFPESSAVAGFKEYGVQIVVCRHPGLSRGREREML
ncbi:hypothetical protein [Acetobacter musti]|nr:hypothetical protein [Acetobacter musti]